MSIIYRAKQEADGNSEGQKGNDVREHDGYENLSPQTIPAGAFSRLRLALFDRIERNPRWMPPARAIIRVPIYRRA